MRRLFRLPVLAAVAAVLLSACSGASLPTGPSATHACKFMQGSSACATQDWINPNGDWINPNGDWINPNGDWINPNGDWINPNGDWINPNGDWINPNGDWINPNG